MVSVGIEIASDLGPKELALQMRIATLDSDDCHSYAMQLREEIRELHNPTAKMFLLERFADRLMELMPNAF